MIAEEIIRQIDNSTIELSSVGIITDYDAMIDYQSSLSNPNIELLEATLDDMQIKILEHDKRQQ